MKYLSSISSDNCDVTFVNGTFTGDLTVDTNTLYVDSTNNRVGIGTTSPHFYSNYNHLTIDGASGSGYMLRIGGSNKYEHYVDGAGAIFYLVDNDPLRFFTNSTERLRITGAGNVGIGTDSPTGQLSVYTSNYNLLNVSYPGTYITKLAIGGGAFIQQDAGNEVFTIDQGYGGGDIAFNAGGSVERMRINSSGNVGIGTASPGFALHVSDSDNQVARFASSDNNALISIKDDDTTIYVGAENSLAYIGLSGSASSDNLIINGSGYVGIGTTNPTTRLYLKGDGVGGGEIKIDSSASDASFGIFRFQGDASTYDKYLIAYNSAHQSQPHELSLKNLAGDITFYTGTGGGTSERVRITSSGNVGIGTTNPGARLALNGDGHTNNYQGVLRINNTDSSKWSYITLPDTLSGSSNSNNYYLIGRGSSISDRVMSFHIPRDNDYGDSTQPKFGFYSTGADLLHSIEAETGKSYFKGNVGIGTTSPDFKLHLAHSDSNNGLLLEHTSQASSYSILQNIRENEGLIWQRWINGVFNSNLMTLSYDGNLGIGTTSPSYKLHVDGDVKLDGTTFLAYPKVQDDGRLRFGDGNDYSIGYNSADDTLRIADGNSLTATPRITLDSSGNVGIGTTTPTQKLEVNGNIQFSNKSNSIYFGSGGTDGTWGAPRITRIGTQIIVSDYSGVQLGGYDGSSYGPRMTVLGTGNVGIGTTSPDHSLQIERSNNDHLKLSRSGVGSFELGVASSDALTFSDGGTERMRIDSSGNVGIGTTSPSSMLSIANKFIFNNDGVGSWGAAADYGRLTWDTGKAIIIGLSGKALSFGSNGSWDKMYLSTSGNVGIGTTSPGTKLHVYDATDNALGIFESGDNLATIRLSDNDTSGYWHTQNSGTQLGVDSSYSANNLTVRSGGNVGIGTTSPAHKLNVSSSNNTTALGIDFPSANYDFSANSTSGYTTLFHMNNTGLDIGHNSASRALNLKTNSADRLTITGGGNVGIGSTSPTRALSVEGTAYVRDDFAVTVTNPATNLRKDSQIYLQSKGNQSGFIRSSQWYLQTISDSIYGNSAFRIAKNYDGGSTNEYLRITSAGNVGIGTASPAAKLDVAGQIITSDSVKFTGNVSTPTGNSVFRPANNTLAFGTSSAERMRITSSGNVGIGTTSPTQKLDVVGSTKIQGNIQLTGQATGYETSFNGSSIYSAASTFNGESSMFGALVLQSRADSGRPIALVTGATPTERMRITSNGNVGIGTTSPSSLLQVEGSANNVATFKSTDNRGSIAVKDDNTTTYVSAEGGKSSFGTNSGLNVNNLNIKSSGDVGIGTTSPAEKLDVNGNIQASTYKISGATVLQGNSIVTVGSGGATGQVRLNTTSGIGFTLNGANVGIGTTSPSEKLHVVGNGIFHSGTNLGRIKVGRSANQEIEIYVDDTNNIITAYQDSDGNSSHVFALNREFDGSGANYFEIRKDGSAQMHIDTDGNVGIDTTSPSYKLDVGGGNFFVKGSNRDWGGSAGLGTHIGTGDFDIYSGTPGSGAHKLKVTNAGNVGIGTTSPGEKLEIAGRLKVSDTPYSAFIGGIDASWAGNTNYPTLYGSDAARWVMHINPHISYVANGVNGYTSSAMTGATVRFASNTSASTYWDVGVGTNSVGTDKFSIGRAGSALFNIDSSGKVGIGTTSPAVRLDYGSSVNQAFHLYTSGVDYYGINMTQYDSGPYSTNIFSGNGGQIKFRTATGTSTQTTRMTITQAGNVGIGTTSPNQKLEVSGNILATKVGVGIVHASYDLYNNGTTYLNGRTYLDDQVDITSGYSLNFGSSRIHSTDTSYFLGGNVGIGTTSPGAKLNIATSSDWGTSITDAITIDNTGSAGNVNLEHSLGRIRWRTNGTDGAVIDAIRDTPGNGNNVDIAFFTNLGASNTTLAERMRINYNGNVLIGTTTDSGHELNVDGEINSTGIVISSQLILDTSSTYTRLKNPEGSNVIYLGDSGDRTNYYDNNAHRFRGAGGSGDKMFINGSGNVGIGTLSPDFKLDVVGDIGIDGKIHHNGDHDTYIGFSDNTQTFRTGGSDRVTINNTGVGIGTTSPSTSLDVVASSTTSVDIAHFANSNQTAKVLIKLDGVGSSAISMLDAGNNEDILLSTQGNSWFNAGNVGIGTTSPSEKLEVNGKIKVKSGTTGYILGPTGEMLVGEDTGALYIGAGFGVSPTIPILYGSDGTTYHRFKAGGSERMRITSSGNVGIGTTSPTHKLTVAGGSVLMFPSDNTRQLSFYSDSYGITASSGLELITGDYIRFRNGSTELARLTTTGLGIGTTSPEVKLHVQETNAGAAGGMLYLKNSTESSGTYTGIYFGTWGKKSGIFHKQGSYGGYGRGDIIFATETTSDGTIVSPSNARMVITNPGNVGIGTSSPSYKLDVETDSDIIASFVSTDNKAAIRINDNDTNVYVSAENSRASFGFNIGTHSSNLNIASNGNVLIGTTTDGGYKLNVNGTGYFGSTLTLGGGSRLSAVSGNGLNFNTGGSDVMHIDASGNVGIGNTSPSYKLDVSGTSRAVKSKIDFTPTSDTIALDIRGTGTPNDYFTVSNATGGANDVFLPIFFYKAATYGYNGGTNRYPSGVYGGGFIAAVDDTSKPSSTGAGAAMHFNARTYANNGPLTSRYLFSWGSWTSTYMSMTAGGNLLIGNTTDSGETLQVYGDEKVTGYLHVDGDVGIGNTSPAYKLDVSGDINSDGDFYQNGVQGATGTVNLALAGGGTVTLEINGGIITSIV